MRDPFATADPLEGSTESSMEVGRRLVRQWRSGGRTFGEIGIRPRDPREKIPLSLAQEQLRFVQLLNPDSAAYLTSYCAWLHGAVDEAALAASLAALGKRHEILRTTFGVIDGQPCQLVAGRPAVCLKITDITDVLPIRRADEALKRARQACQEAFDLERGPLARACVIRVNDELRLLVLVAHHLICDGWSLDILLRELSEHYSIYHRRSAAQLPDVPLQYGDFAVWQRSQAGLEDAEGLAYWGERLTGTQVLELPTERVRPQVRTLAGASLPVRIPAATANALRALARESGTTLFMALLAAYQALLGRLGDQDDVCVGSPVANRSPAEVRGMPGPFMNLLALRTDLSGDPTFRGLLARVREVCLGAYRYQRVPLQRVVEAAEPARATTHHPLFQAALLFQNFGAHDTWLEGVRVERLDLGAHSTQYDLELELRESGSELAGCLRYATDFISDDLASRLVQWLKRLLTVVSQNPDIRISRVPLLSAGERRRIIHEWNATRSDLPRLTLHELVAEQARRAPAAAAIECSGMTVTFAQLEEQANRIAHHLRSLGVGAESVVGICMERSPEFVVALLATLKAGGTYLPLDPQLPVARLSFMLEDTGCATVLSRARLADPVAAGRAVVRVDTDAEVISQQPPDEPTNISRPSNAAYVIYTSGSTGRPKGVVIPHLGIANRVLWTIRRHSLCAADRILFKTPVTFDAAGWEILAPLVCGGTIVVAPPGAQNDPREIVSLVAGAAVTVLQLVPSMLELIVGEAGLERARSLRLMFCAGEPLPARLCDRLFERLPGLEVYNTYGPTECSIDVTAHRCLPGMPRVTAPIGRPIQNTQIYLLDRDLQPVPDGAIGELYVGGVGLARGYVKRPSLTADRFVPSPFSGAAGSRLYQTGDFARYLTDGTIVFAGRRDSQVKLHGVRIELSEIESTITMHHAVRQAVVTARGETPGQTRLIGYLVPVGDVRPSVTELREYLGRHLPEVMIPSVFVWLNDLPLTSSGKIDRKALPAPPLGLRPDMRGDYVAPVGHLEQMVAGSWAELLGVKPIGAHDNFFELGGHSLMAAQVVNRIGESLGTDVPIRLMFEHPTVAGLAAALGDRGPEKPAIPPIARLPRVHATQPPARKRRYDAPLPPAGRRLATTVVSTFADLAPGDWNAARPPSLFATARWLSRAEGTLSDRNAYALVRAEGQVAAVLAAYLVEEGAFTPMNPAKFLVATDMLEEIAPFQSPVERRRTTYLAGLLAPELARMRRATVCACPYSREAAMVQRNESRDTSLALVETLNDIADTWQAPTVAALYLPPSLPPALAAALNQHGYVKATLAARSVLPIRWQAIGDYAAAIRRARPEIRAWQKSGLEVSVVGDLRKLITEITPLYARNLHKHGEPPDSGAAGRTLEWIEERFSDLVSVIVVRHEERPLAFHLFFEMDSKIYSYFTGQTYDECARQSRAFFVATYYETIRLAISQGITKIDYGVGSYDAKSARGCDLVPLQGFFRFSGDIADEISEYLGLLDAAWVRLIRRYTARRGGS